MTSNFLFFHSQFEQLLHLQYYPHFYPTLKHSQYFLRQPVLRQLQPFMDEPFWPKLIELFISISSIALALISLYYYEFWHDSQLQLLQKDPLLIYSYLEQNIRNKVSNI